MSDIHAKLLDVTIRIYSEAGYRGTTTRRIAAEADVNEVTIFRHFGSKDGLIKAALGREKERVEGITPDADNPDLRAALEAWALRFHADIYAHRFVIRQLSADMAQHPHLTLDPNDEATGHAKAVVSYLEAQRAKGALPQEADCMMAGLMLVSTLFTEAFWRDTMPAGLCLPPELIAPQVVAFVLRGLGLPVVAAPAGVA
jgi:AcrR family transcriptional regulator